MEFNVFISVGFRMKFMFKIKNEKKEIIRMDSITSITIYIHNTYVFTFYIHTFTSGLPGSLSLCVRKLKMKTIYDLQLWHCSTFSSFEFN